MVSSAFVPLINGTESVGEEHSLFCSVLNTPTASEQSNILIHDKMHLLEKMIASLTLTVDQMQEKQTEMQDELRDKQCIIDTQNQRLRSRKHPGRRERQVASVSSRESSEGTLSSSSLPASWIDATPDQQETEGETKCQEKVEERTEAHRRAEEQRQQAAQRRVEEAEAQHRAEEQRQEAEAQREEQRRVEEAEAQRRAEEQRQQEAEEAESQHLAEEQRQQEAEEAEAQRRAEEQRLEAEARREAQRRVEEAEAQRRAEEQRQAEARRRAEEQNQREAARRADSTRIQSAETLNDYADRMRHFGDNFQDPNHGLVFRSTNKPGIRGEAWIGENTYQSRAGHTFNTKKAPPQECFNCRGDHWRKDCPYRR